MKVISYALFGDNPKYLQGAVRNAQLVKYFYPGWLPVFWVDEKTVPKDTILCLRWQGAEVRPYSSDDIPNGMFVRLFVAEEPGIERFVIRDCDSRPFAREVNAVNAWIESGKKFHIMRDHPHHSRVPITGAIWGAVGGALPGLIEAAKSFRHFQTPYRRVPEVHGVEEEFLAEFVWPKAQEEALIHDSFPGDKYTGSVPFPDGRQLGDWRFCGEIFDENEVPSDEHWKARAKEILGCSMWNTTPFVG